MSTFTPAELKLAFGYQLVRRVVGADGAVVPEESRFLERAFPSGVLEGAGFVDASGGFTQRFHDAAGEALLGLPDLDTEARLDLIVTLWEAATVDGVFERSEREALSHAANLLGLSRDQVAARLGIAPD